MIQIALDPEVERQLADIASRTGKAPDELARRALLAYLDDLEDYALAVEAWKEHDPTTTVSIDELMREFGLED